VEKWRCLVHKLTPEAVLTQVPEGYTPGDWRAESSGYGSWDFRGGYLGVIYSDWDGLILYTGPSSFHSIRGDTREQAEANAKLMALGPRLVFGLKAALSERDALRKALYEVVPEHVLLKAAGPWVVDTLSEGGLGWKNGTCRLGLVGQVLACAGTLHGDPTYCLLGEDGEGDMPGGEAEADAALVLAGWKLENG
jgi:hypothetical protein